MASESSAMDLIKESVKLQAKSDEALAVVGDLRKLTEEELKLSKESMVADFKRDGISKGIAEEMTNTIFDTNMEQNKILESNAIAAEMRLLPEQIAADKRQEMVDKFGEFGATLRSSLGGLGDAIKEDFGQLTAAFGVLDQLPGIKIIKALLLLVVGTLGKLLLQFIKNRGLAPKSITDRISKDKEGINLKDTFRNFTPDFMIKSDEDKKAKAKDIKAKGDQFGGFEKKPKGPVGSPAVKDTFLQKTNKKFNKSMTSLKKGFTNTSASMKKAGSSMKKSAKTLLSGAARMAISVAALVAGMLASAAGILISGITMLMPVIIIGLAIAALIFGVMYLKDKMIENKDFILAKWEIIKEGFSIMMDGLSLWKDKSVAFIGSIFSKIGLGIQNMVVSILEGIEGGINWVIKGLNDKLGWAGVDLDTVDIGAAGMRADYESDKSDFDVAQKVQADEFASREKDLADRKSNNTMERATNIVNQNNVQNDGPSSTTITPDGTSPGDQFAGNMVLAQ